MQTPLIFILLNVAAVFSANPGFKARITQNGLSYANSVAIATLAKQVKGLNIPDQSGKSGHVSYSFTNLKIQSFTPPTSTMQLQTGAGIRWTASGASMSLSGNFRYKFKKAFIHISDHGSIDGAISGLSFAITIKIDDVQGKPQMTGSACSCDISKVKIHFHGGAAWIYNIFAGLIENKVKDILKAKMCGIIQDAVNKDANKQLAKLPMSVVIAKKFLLDYSLLANPTFETKYMETVHKGEIFWNGDHQEAPFSPAALPDTPDVSRMLYLWISDYMANSLAYAGFKHGFLKYNLTAKDLPPADRGILNTTCSLKCVGTLIPQVGKMYPNSKVMLAMQATGAPQVHIKTGVINMNFTGNVDLYAQTPKGQTYFLLTIVTRFQANVTASIDGQLLKGKVESTSLKVDVKNSKVGVVSQFVLQFVMNTAVNMFVVPQLNAEGQKGLVLPVTDDIHFSKAQLSFLKGALLVSTDLLYQPTADALNTHNVRYQQDLRDDLDMTFQVVGNVQKQYSRM